MSEIVLSNKAAKLLQLCEANGFQDFDGLLHACVNSSICPAICMTEGCDYTEDVSPDEQEGFCEACGGRTLMSARVLAGLGQNRRRSSARGGGRR